MYLVIATVLACMGLQMSIATVITPSREERALDEPERVRKLPDQAFDFLADLDEEDERQLTNFDLEDEDHSLIERERELGIHTHHKRELQGWRWYGGRGRGYYGRGYYGRGYYGRRYYGGPWWRGGYWGGPKGFGKGPKGWGKGGGYWWY